MEKMGQKEFNEVSGGILGPKTAQAMSRYKSVMDLLDFADSKNATSGFVGSVDLLKRDKEFIGLKGRATIGYQKGLVAGTAGEVKEIEDDWIKSMNDCSDYASKSLESNY